MFKKQYMGYVFLFPSLLFLGVFVFYPLVNTFYLSFFKWNLVSSHKVFVGLKNYIKVLSDPIFHKIAINTFFYLLIFVLFSCFLPYIVAYVMDVMIKKWKKFYTGLFFVPAVISLVVVSMVFTWLLNPISGPVAIILRVFGIRMPIWSNLNGWVIAVIALMTSWKVFGYNFIVLYSAIMGIDREIIDSAKLDKIPAWTLFIKIIMPISSATGIYILIITIVQGLQYVFTPIKIITKGGPHYASSNLIYHSYQKAFELYTIGESSAISMMTLVLFAVLLLLTFRYIESKVFYEN
ncbi:carbohydrate ABC transporter permease [Streptococcus halichoeri]|uniref:carbohydrate ABC transporter permease n=1 Tax=Streptococcus halichoeri TaxID=254785 RepID=UPI00135968C8|nr:sugar ABC transporter permease [Streptococcus halichoeri]